ncbi:MAG: T9SS type A sorting domain-containing protein, partial [Melioribacteraceae bacterium]|nr:T9SS type A sorting domain-containing protein [Melioribacteraceae bacterium]
VKELIDIAVSFKNSRNVKIFCGEFGVYIPNSPEDDRTYWYEIVRSYLEEKGIAWTIWDYQGGFGLFEKGSNELFDYDLNIPLINALGLNEIPQLEYVNQVDSVGFKIYTDDLESGLVASNWVSSGSINLMDNDDPKVGQYCISWKNVDQYNHIGFDFIHNRDFTYLIDEGFYLKFYLKGDIPGHNFDVRFVDSDNDIPEDRPWRMRYTIDESTVNLNNTWQLVEIPLSEFVEGGAWENNTWYDPIGAFEWHDIDRLEFVAEYGSFNGATFWIDEIEIADPNIVNVNETEIVNKFELKQNYPNPFNPNTTIKYTIPAFETIQPVPLQRDATSLQTLNVELKIYDILGREISTLVNQKHKPGNYEVIFNAENYSSGVYFYKLKAGNYIQFKKMILQK